MNHDVGLAKANSRSDEDFAAKLKALQQKESSETSSSKTAIIYDPYLDTLGGGERYTLTVAQTLLNHGWQVDLAWHDQSTVKEATKRFGLPLKNLVVSAEYYRLFSQKSSLSTRRQALKDIDLVFVVSDGSVPILFGKKTFLHYQVPFTSTNRFPLLNSLKLMSINKIIVNSFFTKSVIDQTLKTNKTFVIYPPIDTDTFTPGKKTKTILGVGRFASPSHSKRQDVLIKAFKILVDQGLRGWELVLAGGQTGSNTQLEQFRKLSSGYPIKFMVNPDFKKLSSLYAQATFFWHAAGFEVDETLNPEAVEHFGMTTVEAMSAGCVPIVINKGGQKEIVSDQVGRLWDEVEELAAKTYSLINKPQMISQLSEASIVHSKHFSTDNFSKQLLSLL